MPNRLFRKLLKSTFLKIAEEKLAFYIIKIYIYSAEDTDVNIHSIHIFYN